MTRLARIGVGLGAFGCASGAAAQTFHDDIRRYQPAKAVCAEVHRERIASECDAACQASAAARQSECLASAEKRYRAAIRRELRPRR